MFHYFGRLSEVVRFLFCRLISVEFLRPTFFRQRRHSSSTTFRRLSLTDLMKSRRFIWGPRFFSGSLSLDDFLMSNFSGRLSSSIDFLFIVELLG